MMKTVGVCALSLALLGFTGLGAHAQPAGGGYGAAAHSDQVDRARLQRTTATAEARINRSAPEKRALAEAVRSKNNEQVRAVLIRNGMTAGDLKGVDLRYQETGAPGHPGELRSIKRVTIRAGCCPPWLTITIYF
ncbi:MAG TPA: hypothetical protein VG407_13235 [Caulobacteraceae bacterium]|jgi:hypothetical protein|nr:hypothetical protein [Caulobacteraceae bacterium]